MKKGRGRSMNKMAMMMAGMITVVAGTAADAANAPQSPLDMALVLEREVASGIGILMPDPDTPYACDHGTLPLPSPDEAGFPQVFLEGLVGVEEYGVTVYPVTVRVDDASGHTVFWNADGEAFWSVAPAGLYDPGWVCQLRLPGFPLPSNFPFMDEGGSGGRGSRGPLRTAFLLRPSHVEARWAFAEGQDVAPYNAARHAARVQGKAPPAPPRQLSTTEPQIRITSFTPVADAYAFTAEWNALMKFRLGLANVLFSESLSDPDWCVVGTLEGIPPGVAGVTNFVVLAGDLPWREPVVTHGPGCAPVTNTVASTLEPGLVYTNVTCGCPAVENPKGFFKLAPIEGGGWWDDDDWVFEDPPDDFDGPLDLDRREWVALFGEDHDGVPSTLSTNLTVICGQTYLIAVFLSSYKFPYRVGDNDRVKWDIECPDGYVMSGDIGINDQLNEWHTAVRNGVDFPLMSLYAPLQTDFYIVHVPEEGEGGRAGGGPQFNKRIIPINLEVLSVTNGWWVSTLAVGKFPLRIIQHNMPNVGQPFNSTDLNTYTQQDLGTGTNAVAYVTGLPSPPQLTAHFDALPAHIKVDWGLDIKTERPDARKNNIDTRGPFSTNSLPGNVEWNLTQAMSNEVIGGKCTLKYKAAYEGKSCEKHVTFPIRGKNPLDWDAMRFIDQNIDPSLSDHAYFIPRHESRQGKRVYNQYNARNSTHKQTKKFHPVGTLNISSDTNGVGIAQMTSTYYGRTVPTAAAWNWKTNCLDMIAKLNSATNDYERFIGYYRTAYGKNPNWTEPPDMTVTVTMPDGTKRKITRPAKFWAVLILYNGTGGVPPVIGLLGHPEKFHPPWQFNPKTGEWTFFTNSKDYEKWIAEEMAKGLGDTEE